MAGFMPTSDGITAGERRDMPGDITGYGGYTNYPSNGTTTSSQPGSKTRDSSPEKTEEGSKTGNNIDAVYGDASDKMVTMNDFLTLMVAQLKNQDFMNPVDDTQYVTQLAQISTMQQMEEMAYNAKTTYVTSLVGKTVTAAKFTVSGELKKTEGMVDKISLLDGKYVVYVAGEPYTTDEIMEVKAASAGNNNSGGEGPGDKPPGGDTGGGGDA